MRREWIEIQSVHKTNTKNTRSPSMRREWIEIDCSDNWDSDQMSPSMRREWIEIITDEMYSLVDGQVSLHAEGVD